ncbi:NADH dehydrogenase [ubiquinone] 1 beta subcomplex subunit 7-like [Ananas comosus]|uniref:NADH dehydrogenase [ubiquinone] 1 beta subcomplex subunit 7 n=1 Tax=Ananas comosus TaxID=4615 RepID=A0A199V531_ANACO|nr:NADH dehydrogenase [ubiquinone] 1 beta subcomplex subunit 7-like [Ananas comosus]OAY71970.1 NADH dehydrogenase (ubiquinone) 1 beta subcomplex subunit 7 [Ananas comosus]
MAGEEEVVKLGSTKPMIATQEEMVEARVPLPYRDQCAHLLIPLNKCRAAEFYLPWRCEPERHAYEKCEYELVMERMLQMQRIRELEEERKKKKAKQQIPGAAPIPLIPSPAKAS